MPDLKNTPETQEQHWSDKGGQKWLENIVDFEEMIQPIGRTLLDCAKAKMGENFIDIGCGAGLTTIELGQHVGNTGLVLGIDISQELINESRKRVIAANLNNVSFLAGDAAKIMVPKKFADCLFSRFGVMFFKNPKASFSHLRTSLKPEGRLVFSCWSSLKTNLWMLSVREALEKYVDLPPLEARAPGPFAYAEPDYIREILQAASLKDIEISPWSGKIHVGKSDNTPEDAARFLLKALSVAQALNDELKSKQDIIKSDLTQKLKQFETSTGLLAPAQAWIVTARI
jgi:ubiquinone/menaquinone biosynthesis C-methylase UbiE